MRLALYDRLPSSLCPVGTTTHSKDTATDTRGELLVIDSHGHTLARWLALVGGKSGT